MLAFVVVRHFCLHSFTHQLSLGHLCKAVSWATYLLCPQPLLSHLRHRTPRYSWSDQGCIPAPRWINPQVELSPSNTHSLLGIWTKRPRDGPPRTEGRGHTGSDCRMQSYQAKDGCWEKSKARGSRDDELWGPQNMENMASLSDVLVTLHVKCFPSLYFLSVFREVPTIM